MAPAQKLHYLIAGAYLSAALALGVAVYGQYQSKQSAAVVDLGAIASKLGSDKQIEAAIARRTGKLNEQLVLVRQQLENQIAVAEKRAAADPEGKQADAIEAVRTQAQRLMAEANHKAAANLKSYRMKLIAEFRQQSKAVASEVARERGISLVVAKNDALVLDYEKAIDITDRVVERGPIRFASALVPVATVDEAPAKK